jgi:hypothetical protein
MRSDFVVYSAPNHEPCIIVTTTEAEGPIVSRDHHEIIIAVDEGNAASAIEQPVAYPPAQATTSTC